MFSHILLAVDGSEHARRAAIAASTLAKMFGARLTLVNVYPPSTVFEPSDETHDACKLGLIEMRQTEALRRAGSVADGLGIPYQTRRAQGHPVEMIVKTAEQDGADLIVIGSRGLGDIGFVPAWERLGRRPPSCALSRLDRSRAGRIFRGRDVSEYPARLGRLRVRAQGRRRRRRAGPKVHLSPDDRQRFPAVHLYGSL